MKGLTRLQFRCGTIMEGILKEFEEKYHIAYCPTKCKCCGKAHGKEIFRILRRNVAL